MSTETTPQAPVQTANVTSPVVTDGAQPVVSSPVVEPTSPANVEVTPAPSPDAAPTDATKPSSTPEWAQKRINELTGKRHEAERKAAEADRAVTSERNARLAAEARAAELLAQIAKPGEGNAPGTPANAAAPAATEEEIRRRITEEAARIAQVDAFNRACNNVVEIGKKEFGATWDDSIKNLNLVGAIGADVSPEFLETAIELKDPHRVLNYLGQNLEEAEKIVRLAPKQMALELARVEGRLAAPAPVVVPPVSNAPAPVVPITGAAKAGEKAIDDPTISGAEWMALRAKQVAERRGRYNRVN